MAPWSLSHLGGVLWFLPAPSHRANAPGPSPGLNLSGYAAALGMTLAAAPSLLERCNHSHVLPFASLSSTLTSGAAADGSSATCATEPHTGMKFPLRVAATSAAASAGTDSAGGTVLDLTGLGVRVKKLLGPAAIRVYAFGVYVDLASLRDRLGTKYGALPESVLRSSRYLLDDAVSSDCSITVRLVISYKKLKIGQVRNAFRESVGQRVEAISGSPQPQLLDQFCQWFTDDVSLHQGSIIDLRRGPGHTFTAEIDGRVTGSMKSSLLSRALLSLYLGDKPFDIGTRDAVRAKLATSLSASLSASA